MVKRYEIYEYANDSDRHYNADMRREVRCAVGVKAAGKSNVKGRTADFTHAALSRFQARYGVLQMNDGELIVLRAS